MVSRRFPSLIELKQDTNFTPDSFIESIVCTEVDATGTPMNHEQVPNMKVSDTDPNKDERIQTSEFS
jgi:hypothetical protein